MSMRSDLVDRLRAESKSMGKYGVDYMATLLTRAAYTIEILSEKARADRPQGEWIDKNGNTHYCSICGFEETEWYTIDYNFCPNCGAKMRGADDETDRR